MQRDSEWLERQFQYSVRHGIALPRLTEDWEELDVGSQSAILARWEMIRGNIPEHIIQFELAIKEKTRLMFDEDDFVETCRMNNEIADLASRINDLNIWFRTQQELDAQTKQHSG